MIVSGGGGGTSWFSLASYLWDSTLSIWRDPVTCEERVGLWPRGRGWTDWSGGLFGPPEMARYFSWGSLVGDGEGEVSAGGEVFVYGRLRAGFGASRECWGASVGSFALSVECGRVMPKRLFRVGSLADLITYASLVAMERLETSSVGCLVGGEGYASRLGESNADLADFVGLMEPVCPVVFAAYAGVPTLGNSHEWATFDSFVHSARERLSLADGLGRRERVRRAVFGGDGV